MMVIIVRNVFLSWLMITAMNQLFSYITFTLITYLPYLPCKSLACLMPIVRCVLVVLVGVFIYNYRQLKEVQ